MRPARIATLFPYTTLFRSSGRRRYIGSSTSASAPLLTFPATRCAKGQKRRRGRRADRKSTRLNSSHPSISYAVFCLKNKKELTAAGDSAIDHIGEQSDTGA